MDVEIEENSSNENNAIDIVNLAVSQSSASDQRQEGVLAGLNVIRYGSRRVIIFIKNLIWFIWQLVKLSFLFMCYYFVKNMEMH